jgi:hypothetical protein
MNKQYPSYCYNCIIQAKNIVYLMTGYCIRHCPCDLCGRINDLAIVKIERRKLT